MGVSTQAVSFAKLARKNMKKSLSFLGSLTATLIIILSLGIFRNIHLWSNPILVFCDVGQGDASLIQMGRFQILIDAGEDNQVLTCLQKHMPFNDQTIEIVVVSHADSDHVGGFIPVLNNYFVEEIWIAPFVKQSDVYTDFKQLILSKIEQGALVRLVREGDYFLIDSNLKIQVLAPAFSKKTVKKFLTETGLSDSEHNLGSINSIIPEWGNDLSIVLFVSFFEKKVLLTGDTEEKSEKALASKGLIPLADILKVAHHGSKTSSQAFFLDKVQPEVGIVSSGKNNTFGHPANETIVSLVDRGVKVMRTDHYGDIVFRKTNGGVKLLH